MVSVEGLSKRLGERVAGGTAGLPMLKVGVLGFGGDRPDPDDGTGTRRRTPAASPATVHSTHPRRERYSRSSSLRLGAGGHLSAWTVRAIAAPSISPRRWPLSPWSRGRGGRRDSVRLVECAFLGVSIGVYCEAAVASTHSSDSPKEHVRSSRSAGPDCNSRHARESRLSALRRAAH